MSRAFPTTTIRWRCASSSPASHHGRRFDLVIAVSEACLTFVEKNREALFPDTPIVSLVSPGTRRSANSTVVFIRLDLSRTVALATKLQPDATNIFVVSGASDNDRFYENLGTDAVRGFHRNTCVHLPVGITNA